MATLIDYLLRIKKKKSFGNELKMVEIIWKFRWKFSFYSFTKNLKQISKNPDSRFLEIFIWYILAEESYQYL
jgi:hypothetical protein